MEEDLPYSDILHGLVMAALIALAGIAVAAGSGAVYVYFNPGKEAVVIAAVAEEVTERLPEGGCISQAAIWEKLPKPGCAPGTRDVPADAMSYPLARTE